MAKYTSMTHSMIYSMAEWQKLLG